MTDQRSQDIDLQQEAGAKFHRGSALSIFNSPDGLGIGAAPRWTAPASFAAAAQRRNPAGPSEHFRGFSIGGGMVLCARG